jgi:peptide/nickel transport system substrate-binding protein
MSESAELAGKVLAPDGLQAPLTRRDLLRSGAAGTAMLAAGPLLAACGGGDSSSSSSPLSGKPKRGGVLQAGLSGGGSSDSLNPFSQVNNIDFARIIQLYDGLADLDDDAAPRLQLAEEMSPNADATEWTIRLRPDVTFHDGKDLTAEDVIFTFQQILNPKAPGSGAVPLSPLDIKNAKALDKLTVRIPCKTPFSTLATVLAANYVCNIVPVGFDLKNPVGTGPFKYVSFTPGEQSKFTANKDYWQEGRPYVDDLIISNIADETSQINALAGGQVNLINLLSTDAISSVRAGGNATVVISDKSGGYNPFTMRVDRPPFNDVRVRQAFRLLVDRVQMREIVFGGHGTLGNDIWSIWDADYDKSLPQREQDVAQARSLLKQAGQEGLTVQLNTADVAQGVVKSAQVLAEQAKAAGVNVKLAKRTVEDYYGSNYLQWGFAQDYWYYLPYFDQISWAFLADSAFNETHWAEPHYTKLYQQGLATTDEGKRRDIGHELQRIDYDEGSYIIPVFTPVIDAAANDVRGLRKSKTGLSFANYDFKNVGFA